VIIFGPGDQGEPTADDWAAACDTINYEIVTRIGARVPRRYLGEPDSTGRGGSRTAGVLTDGVTIEGATGRDEEADNEPGGGRE
jgi:hypothetical protein